MKCAEVAGVGFRVVALGRAAHGGEGGLVEHLGSGDAAADAVRVVQDLLGLDGRPHAVGIAHAGADGEGSDEFGIDGMGEVDDAVPLRAGEDAIESFGTAVLPGRGRRSPERRWSWPRFR